MSVASKNLFALLDDDAPDSQLNSSPKSPDPTPAPQANTNTNTTTPPTLPRTQRGRGPASRGGRYYQRGGKPNPPAADVPEDAAQNGNPEGRQKRLEGDSPRGRGRGRGGRGGRGAAPRRGREYDRQSGTLPVSEKRVHQGWGGDDGQRELQNEVQAVVDASAEVQAPAVSNDWGETAPAAADDWGETAPAAADDWAADAASPAVAIGDWNASVAAEVQTKEAGEPRKRRDEEEEDNTLTLDQYLAKQKGASSDIVPKLEGVRKPNEGSDDSLWKNIVPVEKNSEGSYFVGKTKSAPKARAKKVEKEIIEIEARFERPSRGARGRGSRGGDDRRGGGRGRGARGGDRNGPRNTANVDVDDQSAFPSLS